MVSPTKPLSMAQEELYSPKAWVMYCNGVFVEAFYSYNEAKRALHEKLSMMKKYPYAYADEWYTIKPYYWNWRWNQKMECTKLKPNNIEEVMITEDYCHFETANLLEEKGFDELCYACYEYFESGVTLYKGWIFEYKGNQTYNKN